MIDRSHPLPISRQALLLDLARSTVYYEPAPVSDRDLAIMAAIDATHRAALLRHQEDQG